jgi:hypothetical protein
MKLESTSHLNLQQNSLRNGTVEQGISGKEQGNFSSERTNRWVSAGKEVMRPSMFLKLLGQSASSMGQRASG